MPKGDAKLWFIIPDIHFPEQHDEALEVAYTAMKLLKPNYSLFLGDALDCGIFSAYESKTFAEERTYDFEESELNPCNAFIDRVQQNTKEHTYFLEGNHCARVERWAIKNGRTAQALYSRISPRINLSRGRKNFTWIPYSVPTGTRRGFVQIAPNTSRMTTGGLVAVHGWSFASNSAAVHLQMSRSQSIVYGHVHRCQMEASRDAWTGKLIKAFSPGCLSVLEPLYAVGGAPNQWTHGFALVYVGKNSWTEYLISIVNGGCVLPDGTEITLK